MCMGEVQGKNRMNGLSFYSYEVNRDHRTSLNMTPDKPFHFPKGFTLSFDFCIHSRATAYGYIFRMIGDDNVNIDLLISPQLIDNSVNKREFHLVVKNQTVIHIEPKDLLLIKPGQWVHFDLTVNMIEDRITININGKEQSATYHFGKTTHYRLIFGCNNINDFSTLDVPPISIKDIRLFNHLNTPIYHWKLDKHAQSEVFDEYKHARATVENPIWEIDDYTRWKKINSFSFSHRINLFPQIAWDKYGKRFFFVETDKIHVYDVEKDQFESVTPVSGSPYYTTVNQLFYSHLNDELVFYEFAEDTLNVFNLKTKSWQMDRGNKNYRASFRQHTAYYDENLETIYTLGGYGLYKYSMLFQEHQNKTHQWTQHDLSGSIHPRYLASMGLYQDSLFLFFGGYGNESGRQQESPHNYYDLYTVNRYNRHVTKLWELETPNSAFLNSKSHIINEIDNYFYVLSFKNNLYETYALLHEYHIDKPSYRILGDSIPFFFNDVESFCNLYKPDDEQNLYALTYCLKEGEREISIYSIAYPPLSRMDALQVNAGKHFPFWVVFLLVCLMAPVFYLFVTRKRKKIAGDPEIRQPMEEENRTALHPEYPAINLLGEFSIVNSANENLTQNFTPTTKQLFLLLLLYTINKNGTITSQEIQSALWQNKDYESTRINRNVYLNKLRLLLNNMKEIQIQTKQSQWRILFDSKVYMDYEDVKSSISMLRQSTSVDKKKLHSLLNTIKKGKLLPFHEYEWLDYYKTEYADMVISFLYSVSKKPEVINDYILLSGIADAILMQDNIDDTGIIMKCNALVKTGKQNQAVQVFKKYCDEYKKLLGVTPDITWDEIINS